MGKIGKNSGKSKRPKDSVTVSEVWLRDNVTFLRDMLNEADDTPYFVQDLRFLKSLYSAVLDKSSFKPQYFKAIYKILLSIDKIFLKYGVK